MCLKPLFVGETKLSREEKLQLFNELVRQMGTPAGGENNGRRSRSEHSLNSVSHKQYDDEFYDVELLAEDAKQIYLNENDTKSEECVF